jgi:primosomal protein N'
MDFKLRFQLRQAMRGCDAAKERQAQQETVLRAKQAEVAVLRQEYESRLVVLASEVRALEARHESAKGDVRACEQLVEAAQQAAEFDHWKSRHRAAA